MKVEIPRRRLPRFLIGEMWLPVGSGHRIGRDGIKYHEIEHSGVTRQAQERLRKRPGGDFGECRDAGAPAPAAYSKQGRPIPL